MNPQFNGYYNGNAPYYGASAPQPKPPLFTRLRRSPEYAPFRELFAVSCILGCAFLAYPALSNLFSAVLLNIPAVYERYVSDASFAYFFEALFTFLCVGLPFLLVNIMLRASGRSKADIPFKAPSSGMAAFLLILAGLGLCFAGNMLTSLLTTFFQSVGIDFYSYQQALEGDPVPEGLWGMAAFMLRTAVVPALVEEFAFRGVVLQTLRRYGDWFAVIISAVMFGFMHGNMTQMPFALIAGVALGYTCVVTGSLWPSVIIHCANNFTAVAFTVITATFGQGAASIFSFAATYGFMSIGVLSMGVFCLKNPCFHKLYPSVYAGQKKKAVAFFAAPTMLISVLILIKYMLNDIMIRGRVF